MNLIFSDRTNGFIVGLGLVALFLTGFAMGRGSVPRVCEAHDASDAKTGKDEPAPVSAGDYAILQSQCVGMSSEKESLY